MVKTAKTTRTTRAASGQRKPVAWRPPAKLDTPEPPEGFKYRWVRHELKGEDQSSNVYTRARQGYKTVRPEELGDYPIDKMEGGKHDGVVRSGDLILMIVPEEVQESRNQYFDDQADRLQRAVDMELDREDNDAMPIERKVRSTVTRGNPNVDVDFED